MFGFSPRFKRRTGGGGVVDCGVGDLEYGKAQSLDSEASQQHSVAGCLRNV